MSSSAHADVVLGGQCVPGSTHPSASDVLLLLCGIHDQGTRQNNVRSGNGQCSPHHHFSDLSYPGGTKEPTAMMMMNL